MNITQEVRDWLADAGYKNHCFISYPHATEGDGARRFAEKVRDFLSQELEYAGAGKNKVFIDYNVRPGTEWEEHLKVNLVGSVSMVAILSQLYFTDEHEWCWREWTAMHKLGRLRHPETAEKPIINVIFRQVDYADVPSEVARVTTVDLSQVAVSGEQYFDTPEFRKNLLEVKNQIVRLAKYLHQNDRRVVSHPSTFTELSGKAGPLRRQPPPLRNK